MMCATCILQQNRPVPVESQTEEELRRWPGRVRRAPRIVDGGYLMLGAIAASLVAARDRYCRNGSRILDVGCEDMPYYPLFSPISARYEGADIVPGPRVDYVCPLEELTAPSGTFDLVLATQVLEHVRDPKKALVEIARVLVPGGHAFVSTHGVYPFHPHPTDYWRWTQQGFVALVDDVPELELVELVPHRHTISCLALLLATYVEIATAKARVPVLGWPLVASLNVIGPIGDRLIRRLRYPQSQTLVMNFLLVLRRRPEPA
jgi:SAM-dependent methyltransferase